MKKYSSKNEKTTNKGRILSLAFALILVGLGLFYLSTLQNAKTDNLMPNDTEFIDLSPASDEDLQRAESNKQEIVAKDEQTENSEQQNETKKVTPIITSSGQFDDVIEVRTFIPGVYESGGVCVTTFTKIGSPSISRETEGLKDATTTRCDNVFIQKSKFPVSGEWTVVVSYKSDTANGISESSKVTVTK